MTEAEYLEAVYGICADARVFVHHCARTYLCRGENGLPDLLITGIRGVLFREVKASPYDRVSPEQTAYIWLLTAAGQDAGIWNASDLLTGKVADEIGRIA
jgi:hypothetical protein